MENIILKTKERLHCLILNLKRIELKDAKIFKIKLEELKNSSQIDEILNEFKNKKNNYIYIIKIEDKKINDVVDEFKCRECEIKISKFNDNINNCRSLYVGSSTSDILSRIKQHLGFLSNKVYALHLKKWMKPSAIIILELYEIGIDENIQDKKIIVETIEQTFWDLNLPLFGKRSGQM